jgi:HSP20 family protein
MSFRAHAAENSFESLGRQLTDLMQEMTRRTYYRFSRSATWQPAVNVYENEKRFTLCVELAGMPKDQIHVDVLGNKVVIKGERAVPETPGEQPSCLLRMEVNSGPFERAVELPDTADMHSVSAKLHDGFLWISIQKRS